MICLFIMYYYFPPEIRRDVVFVMPITSLGPSRVLCKQVSSSFIIQIAFHLD